MSIIGWDDYDIQQRKDHDNLSWLDDLEKNGYDLTKIVIPAYMHKISLPQLSLVEAIESGKVAELLCLKDSVGQADAFFSHVQKLPVVTMVESLKGAEVMHAEELVPEDKEATTKLHKEALETFYRKKNPEKLRWVDFKLKQWAGKCAEFDAALEEKFGSSPGLAAITVITAKREPKYFIDYACIRQCLSGDFTLDRVVGAIETIGVTIAELGSDLAGDTALLRRTFCVLESFATIKGKGKLLVCGPALQDSAKTLELAMIAADPERYKEVIDCATSQCRWEDEAEKMKNYIIASVGYDRTDKVVLAAIVQSCMRKAADAFEQLDDGGASVLHDVGVMLFEVGDGALPLLEQALAKQEAVYGKEAVEIVETVYMIAKCHSRTDAVDLETGVTLGGKSKECYELALRVTQQHFGVDHVATARYLVGISRSYAWKEKVGYCRRAIALIEAAKSPDEYSDTHADALHQIGIAYEWKAAKYAMASADEYYWLYVLFIHLVLVLFFVLITEVIKHQTRWDHGLRLGSPGEVFGCGSLFVFPFLIACFALHRWRINQAVGNFHQSLQLRESKHGQHHVTTAETLHSLAEAYRMCLKPVKAMQFQVQVLKIEDRSKGPLSGEAGKTCRDIGLTHYCSGRFLQAAKYFKRAAEAKASALGRNHEETRECRVWLNQVVAVLMCRSCCVFCGRAAYLNGIKEHDQWLEEDARQRGVNMEKWWRGVQSQRRRTWSVPAFRLGCFCVGVPFFSAVWVFILGIKASPLYGIF
jgi:hypothetical protein